MEDVSAGRRPSLDAIVATALRERKDSIFPTLRRGLVAAFPECAVLETDDGDFDVREFARDGQCEISQHDGVQQQWTYSWSVDGVAAEPYNIWLRAQWQGETIEVVTVSVAGPYSVEQRHFTVGSTIQVLEAFLEAVCRWCSTLRDQILVFDSGCWYKSQDLFDSIRSTSLDTLILAGTLKEDLVRDARQFFDSKDLYRRYGVPWKRGALLLGDPGNGKTHAIKGLINLFDVPCLYVRSFGAQHRHDHQCIAAAFERARESAPCLFILEDLDSLVNDGNRSYFLNELDGFQSNEGILTIATTNHPDRLDAAIVHRPSRFDRKYTFELPGPSERLLYLEMVNRRREQPLRASAEGLAEVVALTGGFSYAYLKELAISAMMTWMAAEGRQPMERVMVELVDKLRAQMSSEEEPSSPGPGRGYTYPHE